MSDFNQPSPDFASTPLPPPSDDFAPKFSSVQAMPPGAERCAKCSTVLAAQSAVVQGKKLCPACAAEATAGQSESEHAAFVRALLFGIGGAIAGLALYAGFVIVTHIRIGYVALAVGWMVAAAMMKGSNGRGGRHYQIAAALLTYAAISLSSIPIFLYFLSDGQIPATNALELTESLLLNGIASPFLRFSDNPASGAIGLLILFVGIRIAWRIARGTQPPVAAPYRAAKP